MSDGLERPGRQARLATWMGVVGLPLGPVMGLGLLVGLLGLALNHHVWEQGASMPDHPLHAKVRRGFGWCTAAVVLPMLMMIAGGVIYVIRSSL